MKKIFRRSPVVFGKKIIKAEMRDDWTVVLAYENEGTGPFLIDLSHIPRWDLQHENLDRFKPWGITLPSIPGHTVLADNLLVNRMNRTQASIWNLNGKDNESPDDPSYTETTDATALLALLGKDSFSIAEKVSAIDFSNPELPDFYLFQGPFHQVPCQIVATGSSDGDGCILLTCSRGYARDMVHGLLQAGREFNLEPAGETVFNNWMQQRNQKSIDLTRMEE